MLFPLGGRGVSWGVSFAVLSVCPFCIFLSESRGQRCSCALEGRMPLCKIHVFPHRFIMLFVSLVPMLGLSDVHFTISEVDAGIYIRSLAQIFFGY